MTIPVLIAPAYNRMDLLFRMLGSVDHPVERLLVVDNGRTGLQVAMKNRGPFDVLRVFEPPFVSMGYGGTINFGILQNPDVPWWLWASNDVEFHPGHLATVAERMDAATEPTIITGGFTWGAVNHGLIDAVGLVDEHEFFPIYFDDNDFHIRCALAGVNWVEDGHTGSNHGEGEVRGSATIKSDAALASRNHTSFEESQKRYVAKWGGSPGHEVFTSPWNSGWPVWATKPDIAGRARRLW